MMLAMSMWLSVPLALVFWGTILIGGYVLLLWVLRWSWHFLREDPKNKKRFDDWGY